MIRGFAFIFVGILSTVLQVSAQPTVFQGGVLNAASYSYPALPGGSIAQGSMFVLFGSNLGAASDPSKLTFPLPYQLMGTSIQVTSGGTSVDAIMIYTTPGQVAAILPSNTPVTPAGQTATLKLTNGGQSSSVTIQVVPSSFGAFTLNQAGSGPGVIQDYVSATEFPLNGIATPAYPGQTVILWGTGLGAAGGDEDVAPPTAVDMKDSLKVHVWVGNQPATVSYAGRSGCCSGIDQVVFVIPQGIQGCYVPVAVQSGTPGVMSNFSSMAIAPSAGANCSDADGIDSTDIKTLQTAGSVRLGALSLTHISLSVAITGLPTLVASSDVANAVFGQYSPAQLSASLGLTQSPSVGSCTVSQFLGLNPIPVDPTKPTPLDAGDALSIMGAPGTKAISKTSTGVYAATLGGVELDQLLTGTSAPGYFAAGSFTTSGDGGTAVGKFSSEITVPTDITWTNSAAIATIDPTKDLTITWTGGGPNDFVAMSGIGAAVSGPLGPNTNSPGDLFLCIAPASAQTFTVPSFVLQALPPSEKSSVIPTAFLVVGSQTPAVKFSASGLDDGYVLYRSLTGNSVTIQ